MDGHYQQSKKWYLENKDKITPYHFEDRHIDEFGDTDIPKDKIISLSLSLLEAVIDESKKYNDPVRVELFIPLIDFDDNNLSLKIPENWQEIEVDLSYTPPGIYLTSWYSSKQVYFVEIYKYPLKLDLPFDWKSQIYAYYREARGEFELENDFGYSRGVILEYCPGERLE